MTQALTGHGYFHRMGRAISRKCMHCSSNSDTMEQTLLTCPHWEEHRMELKDSLGHSSTWRDLVDITAVPNRENIPNVYEERISVLNVEKETF